MSSSKIQVIAADWGPHQGVQGSDAVHLILEPNFGELRQRKVVTRSRWRKTHKVPSRKNGRMNQAESTGERCAYELANADPTILCFNEQWYRIFFRLNGVEHEHIPDTMVVRKDRVEIWEIKDARGAKDKAFLQRTALMKREIDGITLPCRIDGVSRPAIYRVLLKEDLARRPRLKSVKKLLHWSNRDVDLMTREHIRQYAMDSDGVTWGAAAQGAYGRHGRQVLARLAMEGFLRLDFNQPLTNSTRFHWTTTPQELV